MSLCKSNSSNYKCIAKNAATLHFRMLFTIYVLYIAVLFQRPCLCYEGTALKKIVEEYSLELYIKHNDNIEKALLEYFNYFSFTDFKKSCNWSFIICKKRSRFISEKTTDVYR